MKLKFLAIGLLIGLTGCKAMNERQTASVNPQVPTEESAPAKDTPLNSYYKNIVKNLKVKVADKGNRRWERCDDDEGSSCMKVACAKKGFDCTYAHNLEKVVTLCRNSDGGCVDDVCAQKAYDCTYGHNLEKVITMCRDANGSCVKAACKLGAYDCTYQHNLEKVVNGCKGVDTGCIRDTCAMGAYDCTYQHNVEKVFKMCSGQN